MTHGANAMGIQSAMCRTQQRLHLRSGDASSRASSPSPNKATDVPCSYEGAVSRGAEEFLLDKLPEDLLSYIYSLVPLQDAARAACVSRRFLCSWRHYPNLTFNVKTLGLTDKKLGINDETLALHGKSYKLEKVESYFVNTIDSILKKHSGIGMETFKLQLWPCTNIDARCLDSWIHLAIKSGIKELSLHIKTEYSFPCSLLSSETEWSIQSLRLVSCAFRPTETFGCLRRLTLVFLHSVLINQKELGQLLSNSFAMEKLEILLCNEIVRLEIPSTLSKLSTLRVLGCKMLQAIENNAPNLSTFHYGGSPLKNCFGDLLQARDIHMLGFQHRDMICFARTKLPSIAPNVVSLTLSSHTETVNTPMVPGKFLHLKYLDILLSGKQIFSPGYDFFSLISFINASPILESFMLRLKQDGLRQDSIVGESDGHPKDIRQEECGHDRLRKVTITGFCSSRSLVDLTSHILEKTSSLKCLTLDATRDDERNFPTDRCLPMSREALIEAHRSLEAIRRYIIGKVPSNVCLKVLEPCKQCQPDIIDANS